MSKLIKEAETLIHEIPLQKNVRSQLRALEKNMDDVERFEMQYLWEVLLDAEDQQGLIPDES